MPRFPLTRAYASTELGTVWDALGAPSAPTLPEQADALFETDRAALSAYLAHECGALPWPVLQNLASDLRFVRPSRELLGLLLPQCLGAYRLSLENPRAREFAAELYLSLRERSEVLSQVFGHEAASTIWQFMAGELLDSMQRPARLSPLALAFVPHLISLCACQPDVCAQIVPAWLEMRTPGAAIRWLTYVSRVVCAQGDNPLTGQQTWQAPEPWERFVVGNSAFWSERAIEALLVEFEPHRLESSLIRASTILTGHEDEQLAALLCAELEPRITHVFTPRLDDLRDNLSGRGPGVWRDEYGIIPAG